MTIRCRCRDPCDFDSDDYDEHEVIYLGIIWMCRCCVCFTVGALTLVALMIAGLVDSTLFSRDAVIAFGVVGFAVLICVAVAVLCNNPENWPWTVCTSPEGCLYFFTGACCCCVQCERVEEERDKSPSGLTAFRTETVAKKSQQNLETPPPKSKSLSTNENENEKDVVVKKKRTKRRREKKSTEAPAGDVGALPESDSTSESLK